jgi:hypothetical protein
MDGCMRTSSEVNIFIYLSNCRQSHAGFKVRGAETVDLVHIAEQRFFCRDGIWSPGDQNLSIPNDPEHHLRYSSPADAPQ